MKIRYIIIAMLGTVSIAVADDDLSDWGKKILAHAAIELTAKVENWDTRGGVVAVWHVRFTNSSDFPISSIRYTTQYMAENRDVVGHGSGMIRQVIQPHSSRVLEINDGFVNHDADNASFHIVDWQHN